MIERISGTIAVITSSFAILLSAETLSESLHDVLRETSGGIPYLAQFADAISPIGFMFLFFPLGLCVWHFLSAGRKDKLDEHILHILMVIGLLQTFNGLRMQFFLL